MEANKKFFLEGGVWNFKISFMPLGSKHVSHNICPEP